MLEFEKEVNGHKRHIAYDVIESLQCAHLNCHRKVTVKLHAEGIAETIWLCNTHFKLLHENNNVSLHETKHGAIDLQPLPSPFSFLRTSTFSNFVEPEEQKQIRRQEKQEDKRAEFKKSALYGPELVEYKLGDHSKPLIVYMHNKPYEIYDNFVFSVGGEVCYGPASQYKLCEEAITRRAKEEAKKHRKSRKTLQKSGKTHQKRINWMFYTVR